MDVKVELSIVMVSYNTAGYTISCINQILASYIDIDYEIVIVDNASTDNSYELIKKEYPSLNVIKSNKNLGFAGGVNLGVRNSSGNKILLLNPDTEVSSDAIKNLFEFSEVNPSNGIWGGVTLNEDGSINSQHAWKKHNAWDLLCSALGFSKVFKDSKIFNRNNYGYWKRNTDKDVDIISGCFFLTTKELWETLGGLDEKFFMYAEEADFCLRAKEIGYQPIVSCNSRIVHIGGASHDFFSNKMMLLLRGKVELINKHEKNVVSKFFILLLYLYVFNKTLLSFLTKRSNPISYSEWIKVLKDSKNWKKGYQS